MKREQYLKIVEDSREQIKIINEIISNARKAYIEENKPCEVDQEVKITLTSGRVVSGKAKQFGILEDDNVYVTAYNSGKTHNHYITKPYQSIEIL